MYRYFASPLFLSSVFLRSSYLRCCPALPAHAASVPTLSASALRAKYVAAGHGGPKVKLLIVPGHEPTYGGTEYLGLKERDINVAIADQLASELRKDPHYEVIVARTTTAWLPALADYFAGSWDAIKAFVSQKKAAMQSLIDAGQVPASQFQAAHNAAPDDVALRLYGITKWADENGVDLAVHVHMNDAGDHTATTPGNQSGFAIYVPDPVYGNATTSRAIGSSIAGELNHYNATSSLAIENLGVTGDQELIAVGAYDTASFRACSSSTPTSTNRR